MRLSPTLLICFDRPDQAEGTIKALLELPVDIYLFRDGGDKKTDGAFRRIFGEALGTPRANKVEIRWEKENLGPQMGPWTAIQWLFKENKAGIVLEEDVKPNRHAIEIYSKGLEAFENNPNIFALGAAPNKNVTAPGAQAWTPSPLLLVWGWASWAEKILPVQIPDPTPWHTKGINSLASLNAKLYMARELKKLTTNPSYCWSYYLQMHAWEKNMNILIPETKLTQNTGVGKTARRSKTNPDQPPCPEACKRMAEKTAGINTPSKNWQKEIEKAKFLGLSHEIRNRLQLGNRLRSLLSWICAQPKEKK